MIELIGFLKNIGDILRSEQDDLDLLDLRTDEGYEKFNKNIDDIEEWDNGILDLTDICEHLRKIGAELRKEYLKKEGKEISNKLERKEVDHSEEPTFKRPSELLDVERKLQLHKLVQEYVDTMIKPFNKGVLSNEIINDAYAGLYEFGAWILNK